MIRWCMVAVLTGACVSHRSIDRASWPYAASEAAPAPWNLPQFGHHIVLEGPGGERHAGELLAMHEGSLVVLDRTSVHTVPLAWVHRIRLRQIQGTSASRVVVGGVGLVSTLSNGVFLLITAPLHVGATTVGVASREGTSIVEVDRREWGLLWQYARFPAGLPPEWSSGAVGVVPDP